jgi:hypothetical protein
MSSANKQTKLQKARQMLQRNFPALFDEPPAPVDQPNQIYFYVDHKLGEPSKEFYCPSPNEDAKTDLPQGENLPAVYGTNGADPFFYAFYMAYNTHEGLVLSPDDFWVQILLNVAHHVNKHAEALRPKLVNFDNKVKIKYVTNYVENKDINVNAMMDYFIEQLSKNANFVNDLNPTFSTTGQVESLVTKMGVACALKPYFDFAFEFICGIRDVTLLGTVEDWCKLLKSTKQLIEFEVEGSGWGEYIAGLTDIIANLVKSRKGNPDLKWWQSAIHEGPSVMNCVPTRPITGWILKMYYDWAGRATRPGHFPYRTFSTPVESESVGDFNMEAGFSNVHYQSDKKAFRPRMVWGLTRPEPKK